MGPFDTARHDDWPEAGAAVTLRDWLHTFQACVRAQDYARARELVAPEVVGFGTRADVAVGLDALEREQWRHVWPRIREFTFRLAELRWCGGADALCVMVPWESLGVAEDGSTFHRAGRATVVLAAAGARWLAVHTHFSLAPPVGSAVRAMSACATPARADAAAGAPSPPGR